MNLQHLFKRVGCKIKVSLSFRIKADVVFKAASPSLRSEAASPTQQTTNSVIGNEVRSRRITKAISVFLFGMGQAHTEEDPASSVRPSATTVTTSSSIAALLSPSRNTNMAHDATRIAQFDPLEIFFAARETDLLQWKGDILAVGVTEKDMIKGENSMFQNQVLEKLDSTLGGLFSEGSSKKDFTGKVGQSMVHTAKHLGVKWVILIGLGNATGPSTSGFCVFGESIASVAKATQANTIAVALASTDGLTSQLKLSIASAIAKGIFLGTHELNRSNSGSKKLSLVSFEIFGLGSKPELEKKLKDIKYVCSGVILAKELVNRPAILLTPVLAEEAEKIVASHSDVFTLKILDKQQCQDLKMGLFLAVAGASANLPKFIHFWYKPTSGPVKTKVALVGMGLTNDNAALMKFDMGGAAAVLGAAEALGQMRPCGVEVHFIVPACEIFEVDNDSAGGRTLADALVYASNQGVDKMVDLATWNGACVPALGTSTGGIFSASDELLEEVVAASKVAGEKLWRLPMEESNGESEKCMINTSGCEGGGSRFLKQFVGEKVEWLHVDMTGPVWNTKKMRATGFGTHSLVEWVLSNATPEV
ncbi:putative aminopeptidase [Helianthus debilis subsp. tardiflorus]